MNSKTFDAIQMNANERRYFNRRTDFLKNLEQAEEISVTDQRKFDSFFAVKKDINRLKERGTSAKVNPASRGEQRSSTPQNKGMSAAPGLTMMEGPKTEMKARALTPQRPSQKIEIPVMDDQPPTLVPLGTHKDFWEMNPATEYDEMGQPKSYSFGQIESFPTNILAISQMPEEFGPFGLPQAQIDRIKFATSIGGFDHSVLKKNYFYLDETIDIEFYRDLSPYARRVFKNSK